MKKTILLLFILLGLSGYAQNSQADSLIFLGENTLVFPPNFINEQKYYLTVFESQFIAYNSLSENIRLILELESKLTSDEVRVLLIYLSNKSKGNFNIIKQ